MDNLEKEYFRQFGDLPPLLKTMSYNSRVYQILMKQSIKDKTPLTMDIIDKFIVENNIEYDTD